MRNVIVVEWMSLDGVRRSPRLVESRMTTTGAILATYARDAG